jgi:hypothetical protein
MSPSPKEPNAGARERVPDDPVFALALAVEEAGERSVEAARQLDGVTVDVRNAGGVPDKAKVAEARKANDAADLAVSDAFDRLSETPAASIAGVLRKLRLAGDEAELSLNSDDSPCSRLFASTLRDLDRMAAAQEGGAS